jgi:hypothetical protein
MSYGLVSQVHINYWIPTTNFISLLSQHALYVMSDIKGDVIVYT